MDTEYALFVVLLHLIYCLHHCSPGHVINETIEHRVRVYTEHCPKTNTCSQDVTQEVLNGVENYPRVLYGSCCQPCLCTDHCGLNCCPDRTGRLETEEDIYNARGVDRCVDAQYRQYDLLKYNGNSYKMISDCPYNFSNADIIQKCRRQYDAANFDVPLRYILPVYDFVTNSDYKNIYCAQCYHVNLSDLKFARTYSDCRSKWATITYIRDIVTKFGPDADTDCNIFFEPYKGTPCKREFINRCNITGLWTEYDRDLEESCLSYRSVYNDTFRNIHCYLCNGLNVSNIAHDCDTIYYYEDYNTNDNNSFNAPEFFLSLINFVPSSTMDFFDVEEANQRQNISCRPRSIYKIEERIYWELHCPVGMRLIGGSEEFPSVCYHSMDTYTQTAACFEASLILEPHGRGQISLHEILSNLTLEIEGKVKELTSGELLRVRGFVQFTNKVDTRKGISTQINFTSISHIAVQVTMHGNVWKGKSGNAIDFTLLDFTLVFTKLLNYGSFFAKFFHVEKESVLMQRHRNNCFEYQSSINICTDSLDMNDSFNFDVFNNGTSKTNCSYSITQIEPEPFCPRIVLPKLLFADDFTQCNESTYLGSILSEHFLSLALTENETHLFFCYEDYYQHLSKLERDVEQTQDNDFPLTNDRTNTIMYLTIGVLSLSLISLMFTLIIYSKFAILRTVPGLNNMALVCSLIVFQTMSLVNTTTYIRTEWLCRFFAVVTHFSLICSFSWMFICTFHMMKVFTRIRNISVSRNAFRTFMIYAICSKGLATLAVVCTITVAQVLSDGKEIGYGGIGCYITDPAAIMCAVAIPLAIVVVLNVCMYCIVVIKISRSPNMASSTATDRSNITIFAKLSTITGLTWVFGFVSVFTKIDTFAYIFILLNAGQGVFIMLSFVCNRRILGLIRVKNTQGNAPTKNTISTRL